MSGYTVACYYFPNYHVDPRNVTVHGPGWTEWELVSGARPRFPGHRQPNIPAWGCEDESDPCVMSHKIDAAADHGIDAFIFDWYYYDDGPFLQGCVERGMMNAHNVDRIKFGLMWANHDWHDIHPAKRDVPPELLFPGTVSPKTFEVITDLLVERYFTHPSYWLVDNRPYFSVYEMHTLMKSFGGVDATAAALKRFREKVRAAGFEDLHLNAVAWGIQLLPGETAVEHPEALVERMGFDSVTSYVWVHDIPLISFPETSYGSLIPQAREVWTRNAARFSAPYHPNVTMGWDSSPRCHQHDAYANVGYPFTPVIVGNTPEAFKSALEEARSFLDAHPACHNTLTLNCWNEWTEGSYLEPDSRNGFAYLSAVKEVFGGLS